MERQSSWLASVNAVGEHRVECTGDVKEAVSAASNFVVFPPPPPPPALFLFRPLPHQKLQINTFLIILSVVYKLQQNPHSSRVALQHAELFRGKHGEIFLPSVNYWV